MKTRLLLLTILGLTTTQAAAQAPVPAAPPSAAPSAPPAPEVAPTPPVAAPVAPTATAPATAAPNPAAAAPVVAPTPLAPSAAPAGVAPLPAFVPSAQVPDTAPAELTTTEPLPRRDEAPGGVHYRLPPPRLHPIAPRPDRGPRRYGNAGAPFTIGVGGSLLWRLGDTSERLDDDQRGSALEAFATYDVWAPLRGFVVALGASVRTESRAHAGIYELHQNVVQAELMARFPVTGWLVPHLRAAVGGALTRFRWDDSRADIRYEDRDSTLASTFGAGFTLRTPPRLFETHGGHLASLAFGILVEGGYTMAEAAELAAKPTESSELMRATFSFGKLDRDAAFLRIAGVLRF